MDLIKEFCFGGTREYSYNNKIYKCGEFDIDMIKDNPRLNNIIEELKKIDEKVITFNNYFSHNEINGEIIRYVDNILFEIKPVSDLWNYYDSFFIDFIIIPSNLSKNDILGLSKQYIVDTLKIQYNWDDIEDYVEKINMIDSSINLDTLDFNKKVSINLDLNLIENYTEEIEDEDIDSGDDEIDIKNLDEYTDTDDSDE
jgi:hypothetical protein